MILDRICLATNVYLSWRRVDSSLSETQAIYAERGLPQSAAGTPLEKLVKRACKTNVQYAARVLAFDSLMSYKSTHEPSVCTSISHTFGAVAFAWGNSADIAAVGVDIEPTYRRLEEKHEKFFLSPCDRVINLDRLSIWNLKEAAFKCLDQFEGTAGLLDLEMRPDSMRSRWRCCLADRKCYVVSVDAVADYRIAVAWSPRQAENSALHLIKD